MLSDSLPAYPSVLVDDIPLIQTFHVRPYVISILLHRGAVRNREVIQCLLPHCRQNDLKTGAWDPIDEDWCDEDRTRLEKITDEVLGELVSEGMVDYEEESDLWILSSRQIPKVIAWISALGAAMPKHVLFELSRDQKYATFDY